MTIPFCRTCAESRLGPAAIEKARRVVAEAPPMSIELKAKVRAVFASARQVSSEPPPKECGH